MPCRRMAGITPIGEDLRLIGRDAEQNDATPPIQQAEDAVHLQLHLEGAGAPGLVRKSGTVNGCEHGRMGGADALDGHDAQAGAGSGGGRRPP